MGPFSRADLETGQRKRLSEGRWANAVLYLLEHEGHAWVVKDFRPWSFVVRNLIGRLLVRREIGGLRKVAGLMAGPADAFRVDAYALAYRFQPGRGLRRTPVTDVPPSFFPALERGLREMHTLARIVHLDLRNADNILVTDRGAPALNPALVPAIPGLVQAFWRNVQTDLSPEQVSQLACLASQMGGGDVVFTSFPVTLFQSIRQFDPQINATTAILDADFDTLRDYIDRFPQGTWPDPNLFINTTPSPFDSESEFACEN